MCRDAMMASPTDIYKKTHNGQLERTTRRQLAKQLFFNMSILRQVAGMPKKQLILIHL